jgi:hypothetical protein
MVVRTSGSRDWWWLGWAGTNARDRRFKLLAINLTLDP